MIAFNKARIAALKVCYYCPVTRRILDHAAFGLSPTFENGSKAIASIVGGEGPDNVWATTEIQPRMPGAHWGLPQKKPIAHGSCHSNQAKRPIELQEFDVPVGVQYVEVRDELNGPSNVFGSAAAEIIVAALLKASAWHGGQILSVDYEDRYVRSPLVLKLLVDTVSELFRTSGSQKGDLVITTSELASRQHRSQLRIEDDWTDPQIRREVATIYGSSTGVEVRLNERNVSHSRKLSIQFTDGQKSRVVLDQGFGAWGTPTGQLVKHDFNLSAGNQAKALRNMKDSVHFRGVNATYFVALRDL